MFRPRLDPDESMERQAYLSPEAHDWCYSSTELGRPSPNDAAFDLVSAQLKAFVVGRLLLEGVDLRKLRLPRTMEEIWECKTPRPDAVRMFGWFARRAIFIVSHMKFKRELVGRGRYDPEIRRVACFRERLPLDAPKFIRGRKLSDYL